MYFNNNSDAFYPLAQSPLADEILNTIPIACYKLDAQSNFVYVNHFAEVILNRKKEDLLGKNVWRLFPEAAGTDYIIAINKAQRQRRSTTHEYISAVTRCWVKLTAIPAEGGGVIVMFSNTEEVNQAKAHLLDEKQMLKMALKYGCIGYYERYLDASDVYWSDELYTLHGLEPQSEKITVDKMLGFVHPDDRKMFSDVIQNAIETGAPFECVTRIIKTNGEVRIFNRRGQLLKDERGGYNRIYGTVNDITEEYLAKEELEKSKNLIEQVASTTPDLITIYDTHLHAIVYINREEFWVGVNIGNEEFRLDDVSRVKKIVHPDDLPIALNFLEKRRQLADGEMVEAELRVINGVGPQRWIRMRSKIFKRDAKGNASQIVTFTSNINEQKAIEERLLESNNLLQVTLDSSPEMIQVFEAVKDAHNKIVDFKWLLNNRLAEKMHGDIIGRTILETNPGVVQEGIFDNMVQVYETGVTRQYEMQYPHEGLNGWYNFTIVKANSGVVLTTSVITERKNAEKALKESNELLQSIFDTSLFGLAVHQAVRDENGRIRDFKIKVINKELQKLTARNDLQGKLYTQEYPGIKKIGLFDTMVNVVETGIPATVDYKYTNEGFDKWFSTMFVKMEDGLVATNLDITKRKQAEEERFKNLTLLHHSEELAQLGSWEFDMVTDSFSWSDGMYQIFALEKGVKIIPEIYLQYATEESMTTAIRIVGCMKTGTADFDEVIEIIVNDLVKIVKIKATAVYSDDGVQIKLLGVDKDITAIVRAEEKIRRLEAEQKQEIFRVTLNTQEEERKRIAESLHNGLGQLLYGVKLSLGQLDVNQPGREAVNQQVLRQTDNLLSAAIQESRRISHELMPAILEDFGLKAAIEDICKQFSSGINFNCRFVGSYTELDKYMEIAIYRMVQELMLNIIKHSEASIANTVIEVTRDAVFISVEDNGKGFDTKQLKNRGIGLKTIQSKVSLLDGRLIISSVPKRGTLINIRLPNKKT